MSIVEENAYDHRDKKYTQTGKLDLNIDDLEDEDEDEDDDNLEENRKLKGGF